MSRPLPDGGGDFPRAGAERPSAALRGRRFRRARRRCSIRSAKRIGEAAEIACRVVHVGFGDLDIVEGDDRIEGDRPAVGVLPHHLAVDLAFGGNVDDHVAAELRLAAEPAAGFQSRRGYRRSAARPGPKGLRRRRGTRCRAWRNGLRRSRPGSARRCRVRRRPNRGRRRVFAPRRGASCRRGSARACRRG